MDREKAARLHKLIVESRKLVDDKTASIAPELFAKMTYKNRKDGEAPLISAGTRINWNNALKRAAVDLWDTEENNPDNAPTLWEDIAYREGYRIIPETITAGTAFAKDECGWWNDVLYKSVIDANVWTPDEHPDGWMLVNENEG